MSTNKLVPQAIEVRRLHPPDLQIHVPVFQRLSGRPRSRP